MKVCWINNQYLHNDLTNCFVQHTAIGIVDYLG